MLEASAFQALQAQAPYRGIIKPPVELVVHDLERNYRNRLLFPEREWSTLTAGSLSLSVSDHSSGSGEVEGGESHVEERIYEPSPKHNPQGGWGSENPIPNNEVEQELLDNTYSSSKK